MFSIEKVIDTGEITCPSKTVSLLDDSITQNAFLAVQTVAIKAIFMDLLLKDLSSIAFLTTFH